MSWGRVGRSDLPAGRWDTNYEMLPTANVASRVSVRLDRTQDGRSRFESSRVESESESSGTWNTDPLAPVDTLVTLHIRIIYYLRVRRCEYLVLERERGGRRCGVDDCESDEPIRAYLRVTRLPRPPASLARPTPFRPYRNEMRFLYVRPVVEFGETREARRDKVSATTRSSVVNSPEAGSAIGPTSTAKMFFRVICDKYLAACTRLYTYFEDSARLQIKTHRFDVSVFYATYKYIYVHIRKNR